MTGRKREVGSIATEQLHERLALDDREGHQTPVKHAREKNVKLVWCHRREGKGGFVFVSTLLTLRTVRLTARADTMIQGV